VAEPVSIVLCVRRMTGVGGRPEVVIEGSDDRLDGWKEYEFLYKPGNLSRGPPFVGKPKHTQPPVALNIYILLSIFNHSMLDLS
jgi:hypothetical protein